MTQADRPGETPADLTPHHFWRRLSDILQLLARGDARAVRDADPRMWVDEWQYQANASQVTVTAATTNPVLVTGIIAYSSASGAVLTIGTRTIPLPQGLWQASAIAMVLRDRDPVTLTPTNAGNLFLEIMGRELPTVVI